MSQDNDRWLDYIFGHLDDYHELSSTDHASDSDVKPEVLMRTSQVIDELSKAMLPMQPSGDVKTRLLESIGADFVFSGLVGRLCQFFDLPSDKIKQVLRATRSVPHAGWELTPVPGISLFHFDGGATLASADCGLIHIDAGCVFPPHRHLGEESALILQGEILESSGDLWLPGDTLVKAAQSEHSFRNVSNGPAIIAIVLHNGFEFLDNP